MDRNCTSSSARGTWPDVAAAPAAIHVGMVDAGVGERGDDGAGEGLLVGVGVLVIGGDVFSSNISTMSNLIHVGF